MGAFRSEPEGGAVSPFQVGLLLSFARILGIGYLVACMGS